MSHFFVILIQIPYIILSLVCGISVIISNWNEFAASKQPKTVYMKVESTEVEAQPDMDLVPMAA
jgi:predicted membrane protein